MTRRRGDGGTRRGGDGETRRRGDAENPPLPSRPNRGPRSLIDSFRDAFRGVAYVLRTQRNSWIHLLAALLVTGAGLWLRLTLTEWAILTLAVMLVLTVEMVNTALETLSDAFSPEYNPLVGAAKDVAAGAVLLSAIGAVIVGLLVLGARLVHLFGW